MVATVAGIHLGLDTHANRPAGNAVPDGSFYSCSDHSLIYKSSFAGNSWATWATLGGAAVTDATITTTDVTTNNASTTKHGWLKKLSNVATEYLDGTGAFSTPAGGGGGGFAQSATAKRTTGDLSTTSTSFVDATGLTVTLTTGATRCIVTFSALIAHTGSAASTVLDIAIDGTRQGETLGLTGTNAASANGSIHYLTPVLTAGSHTIKIMFQTSAGTAWIYASTSLCPAILTVLETNLTS